MADKMTPEQRHKNMAAIHSKNTKPEIIVRQFLWRQGFRYRLNCAKLPGHPDIVLKKYRTCIFVNGCFWHGHNTTLSTYYNIVSSDCCKIPSSNTDFWQKKIARNIERDKEEQETLAKMGWHCITVWECELKPKKRKETLESLAFTLNHIFLEDHRSAYKKLEEEKEFNMAAEELKP